MIFGKVHGIARYLYQLLYVWAESSINHNITLLTNYPEVLDCVGLLKNFGHYKMKHRPFAPGEMHELPVVLKRLGGDLFHATSISVPFRKVIPTVITIHDLIPMHMGGIAHKIYCQTVLRQAVTYADAVIAPSEFTKNDVIKSFGCSPDKVYVTYEAAAPMYKDPPSWKQVKKKYRIEKPFLFYLGNPKPHKNVFGLIEIYKILRKIHKGRVDLVIGCSSTPELLYELLHNPYREEIRFSDYFNEGELETLYANASVFVFPSYFEGFGLPPLEAMKRGCPVVVSNRTSLPEVVGGAGLTVDPDDREKFAGAIKSIIEDSSLREKLSSLALEREKQFSWEKCARETMEIYEKARKKYD